MTIGFALIGLGRAGYFHTENIIKHPNAKLVIAADNSQASIDRYHQKFGVNLEHTTVQLIGECTLQDVINTNGVDAVIICTPTDCHTEPITIALNSGKPVMSEKPIGNNIEDIDRVFSLAASKNLPLLCCFNRRFDPDFVDMAEKVHNGEVGQIQLIRGSARDSPTPSIRYLRTSHGFMHDSGVHDIDVLRWVTGENPVSVFAHTHCFNPEIAAINDVDTMLLSFKFPSGALAALDYSRYCAYGYDQRHEVFGDKGMVAVNNHFTKSTSLSNKETTQGSPLKYSFDTRFAQAYYNELDHFVKVCRGEENPKITHLDARNSFLIAEAALESSHEGKEVRINYIV